eukprot:jgi/Ulvmu1/8505/UM044_0039.1
MGDEVHEADLQFENTDAGASTTYPNEAGKIRKGGHLVIRGRPCKVVEVSTSKTGKHGHAKCNFTATDIFTGKKLEDMCPSTHNVDVPNVVRTDFSLLDINEDGFVTLMMDNGDTREDLALPSQTDDDNKLSDQMRKDFEDGKELVISVLKAMDEEKIIASKVSA